MRNYTSRGGPACESGKRENNLRSDSNGKQGLARRNGTGRSLTPREDVERGKQPSEDRTEVERVEGSEPSGAREQASPLRHDAGFDLFPDLLGARSSRVSHDALAARPARAPILRQQRAHGIVVV